MRPLGFVLVLVAQLGCQARSLAIPSRVAHAGFELALGQTALVEGGPSVTFLAVTRDERCPRDRKCEATGPVTVRLRVSSGPPVELSIFGRDWGEPRVKMPPGIHSIVPFGAEALRLRDVEPWPTGRTLPWTDPYRIELIVEPAR